ncbi:MAG TPA: 3'-5' exonuclease [Pyrinomonadaceae bacterium]
MFYNTRQSYTPALTPDEFNARALIIDTETVGAGATVEIIEVALGDDRGRIVYRSLVRPVFNALPPASKHRRFDRAELLAAPDWTQVWAEMSPLVAGKLLVAYNAAFDRRALAATLSRYRQSSAERGWRCALQLVKQRVGSKKNLTLEAACAHFGLEGGTHRAADDVLATYRLLRALMPAPLDS